MANAFMKSAARSKREQEAIQKADDEELKVINARIPKSLHRKLALHRIETGENMSQLINRLLEEELGD